MTDTPPILPIGFEKWPPEKREIYLLNIRLADPCLETKHVNALRAQLRSEKNDVARSIIITIIGSHIDEAEVRQSLDEIDPIHLQERATRAALFDLATTAQSDEIDAVRSWGLSQARLIASVDSKETTSPHPLGLFDQLRVWVRAPFIVSALAFGIAVAVALPWLLSSGPPDFKQLILTGITREGYMLRTGPTLRTRGQPSDQFVLHSGEHVSLSFIPEDEGQVLVILLDSRNEPHLLFSEQVQAGEEIRLPRSEKDFPLGYPLDEHKGVETFIVISSSDHIPSEMVTEGLNRLQHKGPKALEDLFSDVNLEVLRFRHE